MLHREYIKVQVLYILTCYVHLMYLMVKVTCWNNVIFNQKKYNLIIYYKHVQTICFAGSFFLRDNAWKKKTFFQPTDPTQTFRVSKGQTKYF